MADTCAILNTCHLISLERFSFRFLGYENGACFDSANNMTRRRIVRLRLSGVSDRNILFGLLTLAIAGFKFTQNMFYVVDAAPRSVNTKWV